MDVENDARKRVFRVFSPADVAALKYAPITSCDIERSFTIYKNILTDRRRSLSFKSIKMLIALQSNYASIIDPEFDLRTYSQKFERSYNFNMH